MKNEQTKKEYSAPEMEVVELKHETNLLQDSCILHPDAPECSVDVG